MELNNLLNALVQGSETNVLAQVEAKSATPNGGNAPGAAGQPGVIIPDPGSLTLSTTDPAGFNLDLAGQGAAPGGLSLSGQAAPMGQTGGNLATSGATVGAGAGAGAQPSFGAPGQPGTGLGQSGSGSFAHSGAGGVAQLGANAPASLARGLSSVANPPALLGGTNSTAQIASAQTQQRASFAGGATGPTGDMYYGSGAPASASLLSQNGIGAYIHLLSAWANNESDQKSATLLTNNLGNASATLRATYSAAVATLPPQLQQKDWSFSATEGVLVFTAGKDSLSSQELTQLQKAFANANVAAPAREVAAAIASIQVQRQSGADAGALAWGSLGADDTHNGAGINLRSYVTASVPGGNYQPVAPDPASHPEIPALLGGMDLRQLVSARPKFFHPDGTVVTEQEENPAAEPQQADIEPLRGRCSCGQVEFLVENEFEYAFYCHCSRCRARTGSAFAAIGGIGTDKVRVLAGSDHLLIEGECTDGYGARCNRCYAFLFAAVRERQYLHVSLGVLSGSLNRLPDHHIYVGSKAPWFEITDDLPQYEELPDPKP